MAHAEDVLGTDAGRAGLPRYTVASGTPATRHRHSGRQSSFPEIAGALRRRRLTAVAVRGAGSSKGRGKGRRWGGRFIHRLALGTQPLDLLFELARARLELDFSPVEALVRLSNSAVSPACTVSTSGSTTCCLSPSGNLISASPSRSGGAPCGSQLQRRPYRIDRRKLDVSKRVRKRPAFEIEKEFA